MPRQTTKRHVLRPLLQMLAIAILALAALWFFNVHETDKMLNALVKREAWAGHTLTYTDKIYSGFPFRVRLFLGHVIVDHGSDTGASARAVVLSSWPWSLGHFDLVFPEGVDVGFRTPPFKDPLVFRCFGDGAGNVSVSFAGAFERIALSCPRVAAGSGKTPLFNVGNLSVALRYADQAPRSDKDTGLAVSVAADDLELFTTARIPFGPRLRRATLTARVRGEPPDLGYIPSVIAWNQNGGVVEIDSLSLDWVPLSVNAIGTIGLSSHLQPEGAFTATFQDFEKTLAYLTDHKWVSKEGAETIREQAKKNALKTIGDAPQSDMFKLPLTYQSSALFLGAAPLVSFPRLDWPKSVAPPRHQ